MGGSGRQDGRISAPEKDNRMIVVDRTTAIINA